MSLDAYRDVFENFPAPPAGGAQGREKQNAPTAEDAIGALREKLTVRIQTLRAEFQDGELRREHYRCRVAEIERILALLETPPHK